MAIKPTNFISISLIIISITTRIEPSDSIATSLYSSDRHQTSSDSSFSDPIVWDSSSLYRTKQPAIEQSRSRAKRSTIASRPLTTSPNNQPSFVDACQSKMEVLTPYYATNSRGKVRTVVNSELMQQAIQVETCVRSPPTSSSAPSGTGKCNAQPDCGCEQKYKWHRLLVLDPGDREGANSKGLFMDWFLFPSNCVCRCKSSPTAISTRQFMRTLTARKT